jgi:hypothetical protein
MPTGSHTARHAHRLFPPSHPRKEIWKWRSLGTPLQVVPCWRTSSLYLFLAFDRPSMRSFAISLLLLPAALAAASSRPSHLQTRGLRKFSPARLEAQQQKPFYNCPASQDGGARSSSRQSCRQLLSVQHRARWQPEPHLRRRPGGLPRGALRVRVGRPRRHNLLLRRARRTHLRRRRLLPEGPDHYSRRGPSRSRELHLQDPVLVQSSRQGAPALFVTADGLMRSADLGNQRPVDNVVRPRLQQGASRNELDRVCIRQTDHRLRSALLLQVRSVTPRRKGLR